MTRRYLIRKMLPQVYARIVNRGNGPPKCDVESCKKEIKVGDEYVSKTMKNMTGEYKVYCVPDAKVKNLI